MTELSPKKQAALKLLDRGADYVLLFFRKAKGLDIFDSLKEGGWFDPDKNPEAIEKEKGVHQIPNWPALDYLLRAAEEVAHSAGGKENEYAGKLMQILRDVTKPPDGKKRDNYRTWYRFAEILSLLPVEVIREDDVDLVAEWLNSRFDNSLVVNKLGKQFLPKLLAGGSHHEINLASKLVDIATRIRWVEESGLEGRKVRNAVPITDPYWLNELLETNAKSVGAKCGLRAVKLLAERVEIIVKEEDRDRFSYIWRPAIEDHEQNRTQQLEPENILLTALRDAALGLLESAETDGRVFVQELLKTPLQLFQRLAFYLMDNKFRILSDIFYENLNKGWFDSRVQHEFYGLLAHRFPEFTSPEKKRVIELIDVLTADWLEDPDRESSTNYLRVTWLSALKGKGHAAADALYDQYLEKVGQEPERPDFPYYTEVGWAQHKSPYAVDKLLGMAANDLVAALNEFKSEGWRGPDEDGLAAAFKESVKKEAAKYTAMLETFVALKPRYLVSLLDAFAELCKAHPIDWDAILSFCWKLTQEGQLWERRDEENAEAMQPRKSWVITSMADLIRAGLMEDNNQIPTSSLLTAERVLVTLLDKEPSTATGKSTDAMTEAINTAKGRSIETYIGYSVFRARQEQNQKGERQTFWKHIKPVYEAELAKTDEGNYEFTVLAARWLPSLGYLSQQWVEENIDRIFSKTSETSWRHAVQGYAYVNAVYKEIYQLLRSHGHLRKVIDEVFEYDRVRDKYIQQITVAYLQNDESLDDGSTFRYVLDRWDHKDIHQVIWFLWTQRNDAEPDLRARIVAFWEWLAERIKGHEEKYKDILSELGLLAVFLDKVDEKKKELLIQSVPYAGLRHHSSFVVEYLDSLADKNPKAIVEVFLKATGSFLPDYPEDHIRSLVEKFFEAGLVTEANEICHRYRASMYEFLKDIYDRFNP